MNCIYCSSSNTVRNGNRRLATTWKQRYECKDCGKRFTPQQEVLDEKQMRVGPRILCLDIETAPMTVFTFSLRTDFIDPGNIITPTFMLCWSAKWIGDSNITGDVITSKEAKKQDDKRICTSIYKLINEADLVVAFNGDNFDLSLLNYRFLVHGFPPPEEYRTIDPYKALKYQFRFDSNKLDFTNSLLGLERKVHTDFQLWIDCYNGDSDALDQMYKYNKNDVKILESHYMRIRPWMKRHPNMGVYFEFEGNMCRICGSKNVREILDKWHYTNVGRYPLFKCNDCGAESVGRTSELTKEKRKGLIK